MSIPLRVNMAARTGSARMQEEKAMGYVFTAQTLQSENRIFANSGGISRKNRSRGFQPGFHDVDSGRTVTSRFANGMPAPVHLLDGVPPEWVTGRDEGGRVCSVKGSVVSGFIRNGRFYTRAEAAALVDGTR